jgi:tRNA threonylcarbamoyladenosine biosynthesis protein TsaB
MKKILSVDTSSEDTSCAIVAADSGEIFSVKNHQNKQSHAESLFSLIEDACLDAKTKINDIEYFVISSGPGSYTGVRIGLSALKGVAFAANKQVIGVSKFSAMLAKFLASANKKDSEKITVLLDAKREEVFAQEFSSQTLKPQYEPKIIKASDLKNLNNNNSVVLILSQEVEIFANYLPNNNYLKVENLSAADFALAAIKIHKNLAFSSASPLYIRQPDYVKSAKYQTTSVNKNVQ